MAGSQVALITGGAQGLGAAVSATLLQKGYRLCISDIQEEKGKEFTKKQQEQYGSENVKFIVCDVTKEDDYKALFEFTLKEFKRIDLVLNNAGIVLEQNPRKTLEINLLGPMIGCQLALKYMGKSNGGKGGMVINTASVSGFLPGGGIPAYTASKHGVIGLTRSYGDPHHLERDGVLFTAVCPSFINTPLLQDSLTNTLVPGVDVFQKYKIMTPEYVVQGFLKLLEDRINGSTLAVTESGCTYIGYQEEVKEIIANL